ncbi:heme-binding protein [Paenarthrobacter sp. RAF54_2]|uniref:heme-binding protein n=1 Tax=Paenarthrobacter sp. RAF54_2 TaxID=3233061 RepID=UPI003F9ACD0C
MHPNDRDITVRFKPPEALLKEESELVIDKVNEQTCYALGCWIADRALYLDQPLAISVRLDTREIFRLKLPGSPPISDAVLDAKYSTAHRGQHSSLFERNLRLSRGTTFEAETGLTFPEYAPFGGAVPIRTSDSGDICAWVIVTGLTQEEDHAVAVDAIRFAARQMSIS